jgi:hypothetical protein
MGKLAEFKKQENTRGNSERMHKEIVLGSQAWRNRKAYASKWDDLSFIALTRQGWHL